MQDAFQGSFWNPDELKLSVAEACLRCLSGEYCAGIADRQELAPLPRRVDELAMACLLLCQEHLDQMSHNAAMPLGNCRVRAAESGGIGWIDVMSWDIATEIMGVRTGDPNRGIEDLVANLTHHNSSIRNYMFELAWFVRRRLPLQASANQLLRNVADTLGYWQVSLGLSSALFESEDDFWAYANDYVPEDRFAEQYWDRIRLIQDGRLRECLHYLAKLDSDIRRIITDCACRMRIG